jgi:hypothetical protein
MLHENNQALTPDRRDDAIKTSQLITRRSIVLGMLVVLVPITALVVAVLGTLLTILSHSS